MILFYIPAACSLAPHIIAREAGLEIELREVVMSADGNVASGQPYSAINPKNKVPALLLPNGKLLTENAVILQYLGELSPDRALTYRNEDERWPMLEDLNFLATELHRGFVPVFSREVPKDAKAHFQNILLNRFRIMDDRLERGLYLTGDRFTITDAYLFVLANWLSFIDVPTASFPNLHAFMERVKVRPSVVNAMSAEGLL